MRNLGLFAFAGASVLIARTATAQPVTRDHRGAGVTHLPPPPVRRDGPAPIVRDHRTATVQPAIVPPKPAPPPPAVAKVPRYVHARDHHAERWTLDEPVVSSYWPLKGRAGTRVRIRGRNFAPSTTVLLGAAQLEAQIAADEIVFVVPREGGGPLALRVNDHDVPVGAFEVAAFDASVELRALEQQRRIAAEAAWQEHAARSLKERAALADSERDLDATREARRAQEADAIRGELPATDLERAEVRAELTLHAQRTAELERMLRLAQTANDRKLGVRIELARIREHDRHVQRLAALKEVTR